MVALSPRASQLSVTVSPGHASAGLTEKLKTLGLGGGLVDVGAGVAVDFRVGGAAVGGGVAVQVGVVAGSSVGVAVHVGCAAVGSGTAGVVATGVKVAPGSFISTVGVGLPVSSPISSVPRHPARSRDTTSKKANGNFRFLIRLPPQQGLALYYTISLSWADDSQVTNP
jgi:hypothetical protein